MHLPSKPSRIFWGKGILSPGNPPEVEQSARSGFYVSFSKDAGLRVESQGIHSQSLGYSCGRKIRCASRWWRVRARSERPGPTPCHQYPEFSLRPAGSTSISCHGLVNGAITKRVDIYLRTLLIHGARSVLFNAKDKSAWAEAVLVRRPTNVAVVALVSKIARTARAILAHGRSDQRDYVSIKPAYP